MLARDAEFLVKRNADGIDDWIRQIVNQLERAAVILKSVVAAMTPGEWINPELKSIGDSNLKLFANKNVVPIRAVRPRDCIFEFNTPRWRSRRFIEESEMANTGERAHRRQDRQ